MMRNNLLCSPCVSLHLGAAQQPLLTLLEGRNPRAWSLGHPSNTLFSEQKSQSLRTMMPGLLLNSVNTAQTSSMSMEISPAFPGSCTHSSVAKLWAGHDLSIFAKISGFKASTACPQPSKRPTEWS